MDIIDLAQDAMERESIPQMVPDGPGTIYCVDCGDKISAARKAAYPSCTRCAECQAAWEVVHNVYPK